MALKYLGKDTRTDWLEQVPARDLSDDDLKELKERGWSEKRLTNSGFYEEDTRASARKDK